MNMHLIYIIHIHKKAAYDQAYKTQYGGQRCYGQLPAAAFAVAVATCTEPPCRSAGVKFAPNKLLRAVDEGCSPHAVPPPLGLDCYKHSHSSSHISIFRFFFFIVNIINSVFQQQQTYKELSEISY